MRVLVIGGAGYIGSHLATALGQAGHAVRILDIVPPTSECLAGPGCEFVQGSVADAELVAQALRDTAVVYHLAWTFLAQRSYLQSRPEEERREMQENLFGTLNLLEAARGAGVRHLLFTSSAVVYGPTGPSRVGEEHSCHPERSTLGGPVYGITKLACERLCLVYEQRGLPVTLFRLHGVFSQDRLGQFTPMIKQALSGEPVRVNRGAGGEYIHIADVLRAFLLATENPRAHGEVFNLAGMHTYRDPAIAHHIVETVGTQSKVELVEDPTQDMISVSVKKLRQLLGYVPERGEFLTKLIGRALKDTN